MKFFGTPAVTPSQLGLTTKGDLLSRSTTGLAALAIGANLKLLEAASVETTGLAWSAPRADFMFGRLSGSSGVYESPTDVTASGNLFWVPDRRRYLTLYNGTDWLPYSISDQITLSLTVTSGKNYDVFLYLDGTTPKLILGPEWTNDTTRATALTTQDGVDCLTGQPTYRWVGTIRASAANQIEDSAAKRFIINRYNPLLYLDFRPEPANSWSNSGNGTFSAMNSAAALWKHEAVMPTVNSLVAGMAIITVTTGGVAAVTLDSTTTPNRSIGAMSVSVATAGVNTIQPLIISRPGVGYHYLQAIETSYSAGSVTFFGDNGATVGSSTVGAQSGFATAGFR